MSPLGQYVLRPGTGGQTAEGGGQRNHAAVADDVFDGGLLDPAFGFVGFEIEARDGFDGVQGREEFGAGGVELVRQSDCAGKGAIGFFVEAGGDGFDRGGQEDVVSGVGFGDGEADFDGGELS